MMSELRRRLVRRADAGEEEDDDGPSPRENDDDEKEPLAGWDEKGRKDDGGGEASPPGPAGGGRAASATGRRRRRDSFLVAKWAILRLLGLVYAFAFLGAYWQNRGLMGSDGLSPAGTYMSSLRSRFPDTARGRIDGFLAHPTLFWFTPSLTDDALDGMALAGVALSVIVSLGCLNSWLVMAALWMIDFSIVTIAGGGTFYSYGWESQLLETGFLAVFLCDLPSVARVRGEKGDGAAESRPRWVVRSLWRDGSGGGGGLTGDDGGGGGGPSPPSIAALWLMRWLSFRISLGAGLIKVRGGSCWTDKTCLWYHFETQPLPSPLSFAFHFLPRPVLSGAVDLDLLVQLYTSWFVLAPGCWGAAARMVRRAGGLVQAGFMANIILSGNFAFLNHLTIIPALACLDDECWPGWLCRFVRGPSSSLWGFGRTSDSKRTLDDRAAKWTRLGLDSSLVVLIGGLSYPVLANLLQVKGHQVMNASFGSFRLVNTYGAFGSVGHDRYEPILSVSANGADWTEVEFPCKPGRVDRVPCFSAPYHYRLDWNVWFLGFKPHRGMLERRERWLFDLLRKILDPSSSPSPSSREGGRPPPPPWLGLLDGSAADVVRPVGGDAPRFAKVEMFHYTMAEPLWVLMRRYVRGEAVVWWHRTFEESLIPPVAFDIESRRLHYAS